MNFQSCYLHKIRIANTKIMKISMETKLKVLNVNLSSEISYDEAAKEILNNFKTRPHSGKGVLLNEF